MRRLLVLTALAGAVAGFAAPATAVCVTQGNTTVCAPPGDAFYTDCYDHYQTIWCRLIRDLDQLPVS